MWPEGRISRVSNFTNQITKSSFKTSKQCAFLQDPDRRHLTNMGFVNYSLNICGIFTKFNREKQKESNNINEIKAANTIEKLRWPCIRQQQWKQKAWTNMAFWVQRASHKRKQNKVQINHLSYKKQKVGARQKGIYAQSLNPSTKILRSRGSCVNDNIKIKPKWKSTHVKICCQA